MKFDFIKMKFEILTASQVFDKKCKPKLFSWIFYHLSWADKVSFMITWVQVLAPVLYVQLICISRYQLSNSWLKNINVANVTLNMYSFISQLVISSEIKSNAYSTCSSRRLIIWMINGLSTLLHWYIYS